jgi:hypothetical protein
VKAGTSVSAVSRSIGVIDLFASLGYYVDVHTSGWDPTRPASKRLVGWERLSDMRAFAVTAVSRDEGRIDVFGIDKDTAQPEIVSFSPSRGWSERRVIIPGSSIRSRTAAIHAVVRRTDQMDVFIVGLDAKVYTAAWNPSMGSTWGGWWKVGDLTVGEKGTAFGVSRRTDHLDIFAGEGDNRRLLEACRGKDFASLRDEAMIRLLRTTGARLAELAGVRVEDLDMNKESVR